VAVAVLIVASPPLNCTESFPVFVSKFVPVTVTAVLGIPMVGLKLEIVGIPFELDTVNAELLVAVPEGAVTLMVPVVAPVGTLVTIWVAEADVTVAVMPLNLTVF